MLKELSYQGNLGVMELVKFMDMASPEQKQQLQAAMDSGDMNRVLKLIQRVTGTELQTGSRRAKKLMAFDFDNTLATSDAKTIVTHADGTQEELDPFQFAEYEKRPGDSFDFSQFDTLVNAKEIQKYTRMLKSAMLHSDMEVVIVTARSNAEVVAQFLRSIGITRGVKIKALGSANPRAKLNYLHNKIKKRGYTDLVFYDDSPTNTAIVRRLNQEFPGLNVNIHAHTVPQQHYKATQGSPGQGRLARALNTRIPNPETGNDILVRTALGYGPQHPAYRTAKQYLSRVLRAKD